jgi:hypothetical protein
VHHLVSNSLITSFYVLQQSGSYNVFTVKLRFFFSFGAFFSILLSYIFRTDGDDFQLSVMVGMHEKCNYVCVASYNVECLYVYLTLKHMTYVMGECVETSKFIIICLLV